MKNILTTILFLTLGATVSFAQTKCFENEGLKESVKAEFTITGSQISGWFYETPDLEETKGYELSGTRAGNNLTVKFAGNQNPPWMPKGKNWIWTLAPTAGGKQILRMNIYGRNYETNKYSIYPVEFAPCINNLASREDTKRVSFAKGASSAKVSVSGNKQAFLISVRQGQFIGAVAFGYGIEIYFPNGDVYAVAEAGKTVKDQTSNLDFLGADEPVPASGDALVLLEKRIGRRGRSIVYYQKFAEQELNKALEQAMNSGEN